MEHPLIPGSAADSFVPSPAPFSQVSPGDSVTEGYFCLLTSLLALGLCGGTQLCLPVLGVASLSSIRVAGAAVVVSECCCIVLQGVNILQSICLFC